MSVSNPDIESAPHDRHILIKTKVLLFDFNMRQYIDAGFQWVEAWWDEGCFRKWLGDARTRTTATLYPVAWAELPDEK